MKRSIILLLAICCSAGVWAITRLHSQGALASLKRAEIDRSETATQAQTSDCGAATPDDVARSAPARDTAEVSSAGDRNSGWSHRPGNDASAACADEGYSFQFSASRSSGNRCFALLGREEGGDCQKSGARNAFGQAPDEPSTLTSSALGNAASDNIDESLRPMVPAESSARPLTRRLEELRRGRQRGQVAEIAEADSRRQSQPPAFENREYVAEKTATTSKPTTAATDDSRRFAAVGVASDGMSAVRSMAAPTPNGPMLAAETGVVILRNGQTIEGRICRVGDYYYVGTAEGELRLKSADVELLCRDLLDGYQRKRQLNPPQTATEHLQLAQWCQKAGLLDQAEAELDEARRCDPNHPMLAMIEHRQRMLREPPQRLASPEVAGERDVSGEELDRFVRQLPPGTAEMFTQAIQPMLVNNCMTSGCHTRPDQSKFSLLRPPHDQRPGRRLTQRNLYEVLKWVDLQSPEESPLLRAAGSPHGGMKAAPLAPGRHPQWHALKYFAETAARKQAFDRSDGLPQPALAETGSIARRVRPTLTQQPGLQPPNEMPTANRIATTTADDQTDRAHDGEAIEPRGVGDLDPAAKVTTMPEGSRLSVAAQANEKNAKEGGRKGHAVPARSEEPRSDGGRVVGKVAHDMGNDLGGQNASQHIKRRPLFDPQVHPASFDADFADGTGAKTLGEPTSSESKKTAAPRQSGIDSTLDPFDPEVFNRKYFPNQEPSR